MTRILPGPMRWLPVVPALVAALLLVLVLTATQFIVADDLTQRALRRVEQSTRTLAERVGDELSRRATELLWLSQSVEVASADPPRVRAALQRLKDSSPAYVWIGWVALDGTVMAASDRLLEGVNIAHRPVFQQGLAGLWFGSLHPPLALQPVLQAAGQPVPREVADLALPVNGATGRSRAVLAAHLADGQFAGLLEAALGPSDGRRELQLTLVTPEQRPVLGPVLPVAGRVPLQGTVVHDPSGDPWVVARQAVSAVDAPLAIGWDVVGSQPLRAARAPAWELQRTLAVGGALVAALIGGAGVWLSRRLARPYSRVFDAVAERLPPVPGQAPAAALDALLTQIRRQPLPTGADAPPGEQLLQRVFHDVDRIKTVLDLLPAPVYFIDADQRLAYWNRSAAEVFGWTAESGGQRVLDLVRWVDPLPQKQAIMQRIDTEPGPWVFDLHVRRADGTDIWGEWHVSKVPGSGGRGNGLIAKVRDLTATRQAQARLHEQSETLSAIVQSSSDAIISTDEAGRIEVFNPAAERIFQTPASAMLGQTLERLIPAQHQGGHPAHLRRFAESNTSRRSMGAGRVPGLRSDGQVLELEASISQVVVGGRKVLTAILRDVTERVKAERQQVQYQLELSELAHRLMAQEKETTQRLAQILHDRLGQTLTALRLSAEALPGMLDSELPVPARDRLTIIAELARIAVQEVRLALSELRPPLLEEQGLVSALDNECRLRRAEAAPATLHLDIEDEVRRQRWPADVEHAAFMIAREALINALRHAQAGQIQITLGGDANTLLLDVSDNGRGVPEDLAFGRPGHLGLVGMRERAIAIGARLATAAPEGGGTVVRLRWEAA